MEIVNRWMGAGFIGDEPGTPGQAACVQVPVLSLTRHDLEQVICLSVSQCVVVFNL